MTKIKKFHELESSLFEKIPFKYILWYQEYLREKIKELGPDSHVTGPNDTVEDTEDYQFLVKRVKHTFKGIIKVFEEKNFSSKKFHDYRKKYKHTRYLPVICHLESVYETARSYTYNKYPAPAYNDISSLISSWNIAMQELKELGKEKRKVKTAS